MKPSSRIPHGRLAALLGAAALVFVACSSSTDPGGGGGGVEIVFTPEAVPVSLVVGGSVELRATVTGAAQVSVAWTVNGTAAGTGPVFGYAAATVGVDTVGVTVDADGELRSRSWIVTVAPDVSQLPPAVAGVAVGHGPAPAEVVVSWLRVTATHFPIVDYLVACSYDGPVNAANWDQALLLGTVAHDPGTLQNRLTVGEDDGMVPGAAAWFAVRARDDRGQLSPVEGIFAHTISYAWTLHVRVRDDAGVPLQNVILNTGAGDPVTTDAAGRASFGPLRSIDTVSVTTTSPLFDLAAGPIAVQADTLRLVLLRQYAPTHAPCDGEDTYDFLAYVRQATLTEGGERGTVLRKWDRYPLTVWIPEASSPTLGWDLRALSVTAVDLWNQTMGEDYLVFAADSLAADIVFAFRDVPAPNVGRARVLLPGGTLGEFVPQKVVLEVENILDALANPKQVWITEIALHELGHALGHYGHVCGSPEGNLMDVSGAIGSLDAGPANAINLDEQRLVRAYRNLPQGTDMARYGGR